MKTKSIATACLLMLFLTESFGQQSDRESKKAALDSLRNFKYSIHTTFHTFLNFGDDKTNTQHYELHWRYSLTRKDRIGIKVTTWRMFAPMGMPMKEQLKFDENNFYPGRLRENGIGVTYQRMIWKGLFATIEILPQLKTYFNEDKKKIANGFKLYTSYHLGYHIPLFKNRMYIEPQIHCQYWPIDTNTPQSFKAKEAGWNNYFLFEPNLYVGVKF